MCKGMKENKKNVTFLDFSNPLPSRNGGKKTIHLGALYIIATMEESEYSVDYRDYQTCEFHDSLKISDMLRFAENPCDIVMISCMAYMLPLILILAREIKKIYPEKKIVLGGQGPAGVATRIIDRFFYVDYVVRGEGEISNVLLMDFLSKKNVEIQEIPGIVYRVSGTTRSNPQKRIDNLDGLPFPAYHAVDMNKYDIFGIITGRGCMYRCKFCDIHGLWGNEYRKRSIDCVLDEIEILVRKYGIRKIDIWDDTFIFDRRRVEEFSQGIMDRNLVINWTCFGRINLMDEKLLTLMKHAGCSGVFYGIESGSQNVLNKIDKKINLEDIINKISMSIKYVQVSAHLIWGFPFETCEDLYKTLYLYIYLKDKIKIDIGQLWTYPTSELYMDYKDMLMVNQDMEEFKRILPLGQDNKEELSEVWNLINLYPEIFTQYTVFVDNEYLRKKRIIERLNIICGEE